jgi:transcriptional regulator with XRE-family HTH domain
MKTVEIHPVQRKADLLSAIGETLRALRTERGLTLRQVAEGAHVSVSYLAEIERGEKDPSSKVLENVAGGLEVGVGDLLLRIAATLEPQSPATPVAGELAAWAQDEGPKSERFLRPVVEAIIFVGIQASGKSTFYRERFFDTHLRINLDMLKTR